MAEAFDGSCEMDALFRSGFGFDTAETLGYFVGTYVSTWVVYIHSSSRVLARVLPTSPL